MLCCCSNQLGGRQSMEEGDRLEPSLLVGGGSLGSAEPSATTVQGVGSWSTQGGEAAGEGEVRMSYSEIMDRKVASLVREARRLSAAGRPDRAVVRLSRAIVLKHNDPELFKERAEASVLIRDYHAAIINFEKVVKLRESEREAMNKRLSEVCYQYGTELAADSKYNDAIEMFVNAASYDPGNKDAVTRRMECLIAVHRYSECMGVVEKESREDQDNPNLHVVRAQLHILFGQPSLAYKDVCSSLRLDPDHSEALEMREDLEIKALKYKNEAVHRSLLGRKMEALAKLNSAIDINPSVPEYFILRGSLFRSMGDFNNATDDFLFAMDMCEHNQDSPIYKNASKQLILTYNSFAMECFKQRHFDSAVTLLNRAIKEEKREKGLYMNRGDCFYRLGNLQFALSDYQQALELDPSYWEVYCRVAIVCCEIGVELFSKTKYSEAESYFSAAIKHNPKVGWFYICRARARCELRDIAGSKADTLFAIILDPKSDEYLSLISIVYCGKSREDLLASQEAVEAQIKLQTVLRHTAARLSRGSYWSGDDEGSPLHVGGQTASDGALPPAAANYLDGIRIRFEDEEGASPDSKERALSSIQGLGGGVSLKDGKKVSHKARSDNLPTSLRSGDEVSPKSREGVSQSCLKSPSRPPSISDEGMPLQAKESTWVWIGHGKKGAEKVIPREWHVLSCPLPEVPTASQSLLTSLKESMKESQFHESLYYSKKKCDEDLQHLLRCPPEDYIRPPPPRAQNIQDLVIGDRSILTASALIKSLKR